MVVNIANRIQYLREKNGMTQTSLAKRLNISRSAVNSWEMSLSVPSLANIIEMTKIFNVTADYILTLSDKFTLDVTELDNEKREILIKLVNCFKQDSKEQQKNTELN
jgi:transcriptional regulator with XRE-family HTH domain